MNNRLYEIREQLRKYDQEHLLKFYDELDQEEKDGLIEEISSIDFGMIKDTYDNMSGRKEKERVNQLKPLKAKKLGDYSYEERSNFCSIGLSAMAEGKVGVYLVAGGQGTRLGHKGPKGTFDIGLPSGKSLFQLQCERLLYLSNLAGRDIPLYIMTSEDNHGDTVSFFEENDYFGYDRNALMFFQQRTLPAMNEDGKILLACRDKVVMSPNGNGGCFLALKESGALEDMKNRGVQWVFLYGIDNALVRVADPYFVGFTIASGQSAASKVVAKKHPEEKVGILCYRNGSPAIVEYSELPESMTRELDEKGELLYSNANIVNHLLKLDFIEAVMDKKLPLHVAHKKIECMDANGNKVMPDKPNGYKFEYFLFDIFEMLEDMAALEVIREEEFAPVKNSEGEDSPKTAKELILNLHRKWLLNAGIDSETLEGKVYEISPLISYYGENLDNEEIRDLFE